MKYLSVLTLLAMAALSGCSGSQAVNAPTANAANKPAANQAAANKPATAPADNIARLSIQEAKAAVEAGKAVIVDVRDAAAWKSERIKDSLSSPLGTFDADMDKLPKDKQLIFYCSCPAEQSSLAAAHKAEAKGIKNIAALLGGTQAWKGAGYPMDGDAKSSATTMVPATNSADAKKVDPATK